ncbi:MAG: bifunctional UDP-N-acetylglucosamine diphosphorylase/glucosamine-1-phosphate N-acetyltransferase GlmU [Elusimicrobiota bacterium]
MKALSVVILAAGAGTRMKSALPKVLHPLSGKPMLAYLLAAAISLKPQQIVVVIGRKGEEIKKFLQDKGSNISWVVQEKQLGTADALRKAENKLKNFSGDVLILCGDTPLLQTATLKNFVGFHRRGKSVLTVLTVNKEAPFGYGRILHSEDGRVIGIVEEKDADSLQRRIKEVNSGVFCLDNLSLWPVLKKIKADNLKKEYYLTDAVGLLAGQGRPVKSFLAGDEQELLGINSRKELAIAESVIQRRITENLMRSGVTIIKPETVYIELGVSVGRDTVILPGSILIGSTKIGSGCRIGPYSYIEDSILGKQVEVRASFLYKAEISDQVKVGPYSHLREKSVLKRNVRVGNFTEVKKSVIGSGTKVSHLSYIGDAALGKKINVGAGVITCNYDGRNKHHTDIGDGVFVGSNVNLVAPLKIGRQAVIGAGSTITDDIPAYGLALARSLQIVKKNWVKKRRKKTDA